MVNKDPGNHAECAVNTPATAMEEASTPGDICVYLGGGAAKRAAEVWSIHSRVIQTSHSAAVVSGVQQSDSDVSQRCRGLRRAAE